MAVNRLLTATASTLLILSVCPAAADDTGIAVIHTMRREGRALCFLDHFHYGSSKGVASERLAKVAALKSWSNFVALEYGSDWAHYSRAHSRSIKCERDGTVWGCLVEARPCN